MQPLHSKYAIIMVIYHKNHPPFPLNCYLYAQQTYQTHSPKLRLLLVLNHNLLFLEVNFYLPIFFVVDSFLSSASEICRVRDF